MRVLHVITVRSNRVCYFSAGYTACAERHTKAVLHQHLGAVTLYQINGHLQHQPRVDFVVQLSVVLEEGVDHAKAADLFTCWT